MLNKFYMAKRLVSQLLAGAVNSMLWSDGTTSQWSTSPAVSGSLTAGGGLNVGTASGAATGEVKSSSHVKAGGRVFAGNQATFSFQQQYSLSIPANTPVTVSSFPFGRYWVLVAESLAMGDFISNSVSTLTDKGSDATIQIGGADPGVSSSKVWITLSSGTLTIYNRYASPRIVGIAGIGYL